MFLAPDGKPLGYREAVVSGVSVGVPGVTAMLELAHKEKGKLPWSDLFAPAIVAARDGFPVSSRLAAWLARIPSLREEEAARALYFHPDGSPRKLDERITNPALAETMGLIAKQGGACDVRRSDCDRDGRARAQPSAGRARLSAADLARLQADQARGGVRPLSCLDRLRHAPAVVGWHRDPAGAGPDPSRSTIQRDPPNDLRAIHLIAEASRLAFADRDRYVADPAFVDVPVAGDAVRRPISRSGAS